MQNPQDIVEILLEKLKENTLISTDTEDGVHTDHPAEIEDMGGFVKINLQIDRDDLSKILIEVVETLTRQA